ncbi:MAG: Endoglucanase-like protein [Gemmatimonadetes bacterium]|nr:Endoglucanase-like protein [Gemmatimonadota bacterium]
MRSRVPIISAAIVLLSCSEHQPAAPAQGAVLAPKSGAPATSLERLRCTGRVTSKIVSCARPSSDVHADLIVGGQGTYIQLTSSNVAYNSGTSIFSVDVTVQNLIPQALGTVDGTTGDPAGVEVFFSDPPVVTVGSGSVSVANADGQGTFTGTNQGYFAYAGAALGADGLLSPNETSSAKTWQFNLDPGVDFFEFWVYINAKVRYPNGYVDATAPSPYLNQTSTQTVTATSRTAVGNVVPGSTMNFVSSAPAVATVDPATGQITAVAPGVATINVTSAESTTGSVTVQVCPNLAVGEVYSTSGATDGLSVCLGGGGSAREYTMLPMNTASTSISLTVTGTGIQAATGPPSPDQIPTGGVRVASLSDGAGASMASFGELMNVHPHIGDPESSGIPHDALLRLHMRGGRAAPRGAEVPEDEFPPDAEGVIAADGAPQRLRWYPTQPADGASAGRAESGGDGLVLASTAPPSPAVGDLVQYNTNSACSGTPSIRTGRIASLSVHAMVVADTANPAGGFTTAQYDSIALEFDTIPYPAVVNNFGASTDLDGNGRVILFYTRAMNETSPPASSTVNLGSFYSKDVFGSDGCSNSSGGPTTGIEILYLLVPDPTGAVNSNVRTVSFVRGSTITNIGHELQHQVNALRRTWVTGASAFEDGWLDEAMSSATEELMFYRTSGMVPRSNVGPGTNAVSGVQLNSKRVSAYNTYESQQISKFRPWLQRPDTVGLVSSPQSFLARQGFGGTFLRYATDRVNSGDAGFFSALVNSNLQGLSNLQNAIGGADPYDWIRDYEIALYADDASLPVAARYTTPSWNYRALYTLLFGSYSLGTRALSNGVGVPLTYKPGGAAAYFRFGVPSASFAKITSTTATSAPFRFSWVRTK